MSKTCFTPKVATWVKLNNVNPWIELLFGVVCAGLGGELFVRGAVGLAQWMRVSAGIIGATVAAFATSSPELAVSVSAAVEGKPQIALGDAIGSNIVNMGLVLAVALLMAGIRAPRDDIRRDFPLALLAPFVLALFVWDGQVSRLDGALLLGVFVLWLIVVTRDARRERNATAEVLGEAGRGRILLAVFSGLVLLIVAGRAIVSGAKGISVAWGWDEFLVGATLVAAATSTPELATTLIARLRGHDEVGLGTVLGSNIFNMLFIVGVAALITPISVSVQDVATGLIFGALTVLVIFPPRSGFINRPRGALLLCLYGTYLVTLLRL